MPLPKLNKTWSNSVFLDVERQNRSYVKVKEHALAEALGIVNPSLVIQNERFIVFLNRYFMKCERFDSFFKLNHFFKQSKSILHQFTIC